MSLATRQRLLTLQTAPASEPVTLSEAKSYLRLDSSAEDSLVNLLITAARKSAEEYLRRSLITQSWKLAYDDFIAGDIALPRAPVQSITSVALVDINGGSTAVSPATYSLNAAKTQMVLDGILSAHRIDIVYVAGYGVASDVPAPLRQGILAHLAEMFDRRSAAAGFPASVQALYAPYRELSI